MISIQGSHRQSPSLYDFQETIVDQLLEAFSMYQYVLLQLQTGAGKTVIAGHIAHKLLEIAKRTAFIVHRNELVRQAADTMTDFGLGDEVGLITAKQYRAPWKQIQLATIQTLVRNFKDLLPPDLIIIDEAHHSRAASYEKLWQNYPNAKILGLTATPLRLDGKPFIKYFQHMVQGPSTRHLMDIKRLSPYEIYEPTGAVLDVEGEDVKKGTKEYNQQDVIDLQDRFDMVGKLKPYAETLLRGRKTIVFCTSVKQSEETVEMLNSIGFNFKHVDAHSAALLNAIKHSKRSKKAS